MIFYLLFEIVNTFKLFLSLYKNPNTCRIIRRIITTIDEIGDIICH